MKKYSVLLFSILFVFILSKSITAGAWTQQKGKGYFQIGSQILRANQFYEPGGNKIDITTLGTTQLLFTVNMGLQKT
jgi:hypothetical protein